ncbi:MAG: MCE family protein [Myxococcales bacterium]|nr:MCE family protein [Myxococcales bacterium]
MKAVSAGVKVGILFLLAAIGVYGVWKSIGTSPAGDSSFRLWGQFHDASGLPVGSKVVVAGLPVGEITGLTIDGRYARIDFHIRDDVKVYSNAVVYKKSSSLLGDYYLEIDPGSEVVEGPGGAGGVDVDVPVRLKNGDQVPRVVESTTVDAVLRRVEETLPNVDQVLASIKDLAEDLRRLVKGPIASIAGNVDALVQKESGTVSDILAKANRTMDRFDQISRDLREISAGADERIAHLLDNLEEASAEAKDLVATAKGEVEQTGAKLRDKLDLVDDVIARTDSIATKVDEDRGTLGRLVNDPTIADNVEEITEDAGSFLGTLFGLQAYVGLRTEWNVFAGGSRNYISVELYTRPDKYYLVELERGPRGNYPAVTLEMDPTTNPDQWVRRAVIEDKMRFTFQFAKRFSWLTLRYGIKESTGGVGADADVTVPWLERELHVSADVFDTTFDQLPRVKLAAALEMFRHIYILGGVDELLNPPDTLAVLTGTDDVPTMFDHFRFGRDYFLGGMVRFNDEDLAALLAVGGSALSGAGK